MPVDRLQKVLAAAGVASRRAAERLIVAGRVTVDGRVASLGEQVDPATATIAVDGRSIGEPVTATYLVLHKPAGVTSTVSDRHAARTVLDLVPAETRAAGRLYPVGRLDLDSEGLLLLTNQGAWADRVLHPRYGVEREYAVGVRVPLAAEDAERLVAGIRLDEGVARAVNLRAASATETRLLVPLLDPAPPNLTWYRVTLDQGWKRQLRRMFAAVGRPVVRLVRVRVGTLRLGALRSGEARRLTPGEVRSLAGRDRLHPRPAHPPGNAPGAPKRLDGDGRRGRPMDGPR